MYLCPLTNKLNNMAIKMKLTPQQNEFERGRLTIDEALSVLSIHLEGKKQRVHTIEGGWGFMMGCDMDLSDIKKIFKTTKYIGVAGSNMKGMGHGIVFEDEKKGYTFLETNKKKLDALFERKHL